MLKREGLDSRRAGRRLGARAGRGGAGHRASRHYHELLANAADYMVDRYDADVVFVPMEPKMVDSQHCHAVDRADAARPARHGAQGRVHVGPDLALMEHFAFAVGMRLHFLIFAALQRVPFVALPYAPKVSGFLEDLEIADAAAQAGERRPADRLHRPRVGPAAQLQARIAPGAAGAAGARPAEQRDRAAPARPVREGQCGREGDGVADASAAAALAQPSRSHCRRVQAMVAAETDVLVVGGGPAGLGAALGAAEAGAEVILAERYGFLGGNATAALVMPLMSFHTQRASSSGRARPSCLPTDHGPGEPVVAGVL